MRIFRLGLMAGLLAAICLPAPARAQTFTFVAKYTVGGAGEATYYDSDQNLMGICAPAGTCLMFHLDGTAAGNYTTPTSGFLDAADYDPVQHHVIFVTQDCVVTEADSVTHAKVSSATVGFGASICAGVALGRDNNLYVASYGGGQVIVVDRTATNLVRKIDLSPLGFGGIDGITNVPGSDNIIVLSSGGSGAMTITPMGVKVSGPSAVGTGAIFMGGPPAAVPDDLSAICKTGHVWICEAYAGVCYDYAPATGVTAGSCGCHETSGAFLCPSGMMCSDTSNTCVPIPDMAMPDFLLPDLALPDLAVPDLALPDLALPDESVPDLTTAAPDQTSAPAPDLATASPSGATPGGCGCHVGNAAARPPLSLAIALLGALAFLVCARRRSRRAPRDGARLT